MKMSFTRSGGFGAVTLHTEFDDREMPVSERKRLRSILLDQTLRDNDRPRPDEFRYELLLVDEEGKRSLSWTDSSLPADAQPLIDWLVEKARE
jgi:hypothetical protein